MQHFLFLFLLSALATAQNQSPLKDRLQGWFDKAKSYIPAASPTPVETVVEKVVEKTVTPLNLSNWQSVLESSWQAQDWIIFLTGGNKTCFGRCQTAETSFNKSVLLFSADLTSPNLAYLDCENEQILCSIWAAAPPSVWHLQVPQSSADEHRLPSPLHIVNLNTTTVTPETIYKIHSEKTFKEASRYEGPLHPFDGWLAKYGLNVPLGYVMYGVGTLPSWLIMIAISIFTRTFMSRRLNPSSAAGRPAQTSGAN